MNTIIKSIADGVYDDLISKVPENYRERLNRIARVIYGYTKSMKEKIEDYYAKAPKEDKKEFMIWVNDNCPKEIQGCVRQKYLSGEYDILKTCYNNNIRYKRISELALDQKLFADLEEI